jgi:hypothetical protein
MAKLTKANAPRASDKELPAELEQEKAKYVADAGSR